MLYLSSQILTHCSKPQCHETSEVCPVATYSLNYLNQPATLVYEVVICLVRISESRFSNRPLVHLFSRSPKFQCYFQSNSTQHFSYRNGQLKNFALQSTQLKYDVAVSVDLEQHSFSYACLQSVKISQTRQDFLLKLLCQLVFQSRPKNLKKLWLVIDSIQITSTNLRHHFIFMICLLESVRMCYFVDVTVKTIYILDQ